MIDYLQYFFNPAHLLSLRPPLMHPRALWILAIVFGACILSGVAIKLLAGRQRDALKIKAMRRLTNMFITMGCVGFVYWFFAYEGAILLSARFWLLLWAAVICLWLGVIGYYRYGVVPKQRKEIQQKRQFEKYLP